MYSATDKMYQLLRDEQTALQIANRFGLPLGVGEKTIDEVCHAHDIDTYTFLAVVNYALHWNRQCLTEPTYPPIVWGDEVHVPTLMRYVQSAHTYFLDFKLPRIRRQLLNAISPAQNKDERVQTLIVRFYDDYVEEIRTHIEHETAHAVYLHPSDDEHMALKLQELKDLIIKYYPQRADSLLFTVLHEIGEVEEEMALHCGIEDHLLTPAMQRNQKHVPLPAGANTDEELSDRERDVLVQIVNGLSNKEIADRLCISPHTVMSHRKNISRKLNIHSAAGLTIYAIANGLIEVR